MSCECSACGFIVFSNNILTNHLIGVLTIVEIRYPIYQRLSKRRLCKE